MKAKAKKTAVKKPATKRSAPRKQADPAKVRQEIAGIVKSKAKGITAAVVDKAMHGELAPAKYLLEMAGVYPLETEKTETTPEEDCLAKTLLSRIEAAKATTEGNTEDDGDEDSKDGGDVAAEPSDPKEEPAGREEVVLV